MFNAEWIRIGEKKLNHGSVEEFTEVMQVPYGVVLKVSIINTRNTNNMSVSTCFLSSIVIDQEGDKFGFEKCKQQ